MSKQGQTHIEPQSVAAPVTHRSLRSRPFAALSEHERVARTHTGASHQGHSFGEVDVYQRTPLIVQPKLKLGPVNDKYEQEADRVAAQVVGQMNRPSELQADKGSPRPMPTIQRVSNPNEVGMAVAPDVEAEINEARGGGQSLPSVVRPQMEQTLGTELGHIRIHTDRRADNLSHALQAHAFTVGANIFFSRSAYAPGTRNGARLLAHELIHSLQQSGLTRWHQPGTIANQPSRSESATRTIEHQAVIQRHCYRTIDPGPYVKLDQDLKKDPITKHFKKEFEPVQRTKIIALNKKRNNGQIFADNDVAKANPLVELSSVTEAIPHIDHIFPKQKGGSNSYGNAEVMSAGTNLRFNSSLARKSDVGKSEDTTRKGLYADLAKTGPHVEPGAFTDFTPRQRKAILDRNRELAEKVTGTQQIIPDAELIAIKEGKLDKDEATILSRIDTSQILHIDHILPRTRGGCNYYRNARILSAKDNIAKSDDLTSIPEGVDKDQLLEDAENEDYEEGETSLTNYLRDHKPKPSEATTSKRARKNVAKAKDERSKNVLSKRGLLMEK